MLVLHIDKCELYNETANEFLFVDEQDIVLEHSLLSISKWEEKWEKPFLSEDNKLDLNDDEFIDYVRCMTITKNVDPLVYLCLGQRNLNAIMDYMNRPHTATTIKNYSNTGKKSSEGVTSELIYFWMTVYNIPSSYEKWHINRLLTLIQICNVKNQPEKKMSRGDQMKQQRALNAARRKRFNSRG